LKTNKQQQQPNMYSYQPTTLLLYIFVNFEDF